MSLAGEAAKAWVMAQPVLGPIAGALEALSGVGTFIGVAWSVYSAWKEAKERKEDEKLLRLLLDQVVTQLRQAIDNAVKELEDFMDEAELRRLTGDFNGALKTYRTIASYWETSDSDLNSLLGDVNNVIEQLRLLILDNAKALDYCLRAYQLVVPAYILHHQVVLLMDTTLPFGERPTDGSPSVKAISDIQSDMFAQDQLIAGLNDRVRKASNRQFYGPDWVTVKADFEGVNLPEEHYFVCFYKGKRMEDFPPFYFTTYAHTPIDVYKKARQEAEAYFVKAVQEPEADRFALNVVNLRKAQSVIPQVPSTPA